MRTFCRAILLLAMAFAVGMAWAQGPVSGDSSGAGVQGTASNVAVITVRGEIDYGLWKSLERRKKLALDAGAEVIIFELDSYGGGLFEGIDIADLINGIKSEGVKTVAYVHNKAISAGAMIALACQEIVMRRHTTIGDCQAIMISPQTRTIEPAPEKIQTNVRAVMRKYAQSNGYPELVAEAMVDPGLTVYKVVFNDGTVQYVALSEYERLKASPEDEKKIDKDKTTLVVAADKLLTMTDSEAVRFDISTASVSDRQEAIRRYSTPDAVVAAYDTTWSEEMVRFLNSMAVSAMLMLVGMFSLYMAFKTPGFGLPEAMAIICFGIFFLSKHLHGLANQQQMFIQVLVFVVGIVLLGIEIFVIPGFGVVGILGVACIMASLVLALQGLGLPGHRFEPGRLFENLALVLGSFLGSTVAFMLLVRFLPQTPVLRRLVLRMAENRELGYVVDSAGRQDLVGKDGIAMSALRPSGRAEIDGQAMLVVADSEFIEPGSRVIVSEVRGNHVVVCKA